MLHRYIGALILTYFCSRLTMRFGPTSSRTLGLLLVHAISFSFCLFLILIVRQPFGAFSLAQPVLLLGSEGVWIIIDLARRNFPPKRIPG